MQAFLAKCVTNVIDQALHFLDMSPCDIFLFPKLKLQLWMNLLWIKIYVNVPCGWKYVSAYYSMSTNLLFFFSHVSSFIYNVLLPLWENVYILRVIKVCLKSITYTCSLPDLAIFLMVIQYINTLDRSCMIYALNNRNLIYCFNKNSWFVLIDNIIGSGKR